METWLLQFVYATIAFAVFGVILCIIGSVVGNRSGSNAYEKGVNRSVGLTTATLSTICMWLIYTSAYFHQVYPMVMPLFEDPDKAK